MPLNMNNYLEENKWFQIIDCVHVVEGKPTKESYTPEEQAAAKKYIRDHAKPRFRIGLKSAIVTETQLPENVTVSDTIISQLRSFKEDIETLEARSANGVQIISCKRRTLLWCMIALLPEVSKAKKGSAAIQDANDLLSSLGADPLSPRVFEEFVIMAGLQIGLGYAEMLATCLRFNPKISNPPALPNDFTLNQTGNIRAAISHMQVYEDLITHLQKNTNLIDFAHTRNTPYRVLFDMQANKNDPTGLPPHYFRDFVFTYYLELDPADLPHYLQDYSVADLYMKIIKLIYPENPDYARRFDNLYHLYMRRENSRYRTEYPGLKNLLRSGVLKNAESLELRAQNSTTVSFLIRFMFHVYASAIADFCYKEFYSLPLLRPAPDYDPYFTVDRLEELADIFPSAFLDPNDFYRLISRSYEHTPPAGLLAYQILTKAYPTDIADEEDGDHSDVEYDEDPRDSYNSSEVELIREIDFSTTSTIEQAISIQLQACGYAGLSLPAGQPPRDRFLRFLHDVIEEAFQSCPKGSSGIVIHDKIFRLLKSYLQ